MKRVIVLASVVSALAFAPASFAYFTQDTLPPTWHIHNGGSCSQCAALGFLPTVLGESVADYMLDPAECPDATDKALLGGGQPSVQSSPGLNGEQPLAEGICMTSTTIIHLKRVEADQPVPAEFSLVPANGSHTAGWPTTVDGRIFYTYFMLTSQ
jgi:hypothetical protein